MPDGEQYRKRCRHEGCEKSFVPHRWAAGTKAGAGWFHQRNGDSWCPSHIPDWVEAWRAKKEK